MSISNHRDYILGQLQAALGTADPSQGKTHAAKSTKGAAFVLTHLSGGDGITLYVRRDGDVDAFAHVVIDWSVPALWTVRIWDTSPVAPRGNDQASWSIARPLAGITDVCVVVRALAGQWLHPDGGVRSMTEGDLDALTIAAANGSNAADA
jgi:hypothetical protein